MEEIQERRDLKRVPGGLKLHQYANLYFHARNPMLFKRKDKAGSLCVLRISIEVRHIDGITDNYRSKCFEAIMYASCIRVRKWCWIMILFLRWIGGHPNRFEWLARKSKK